MTLLPRIKELMNKEGMDDVILMGGGIIPDEDRAELEQLGVQGMFGPGASTQDIIQFIQNAVEAQPQA